MKELVKGHELDLWVCRYFQVLPTDPRFKELGEAQKYLLFTSFLEHPTMDDMHKAYHMQGTNVVTEKTARDLKTIGYTPEQIKRIQEQLEKAGI